MACLAMDLNLCLKKTRKREFLEQMEQVVPDSSSGYSLRGTPIVRLVNQERETPVVNNITQVTQVVGGAERVATTVDYISNTYDPTFGTCSVGNARYSPGWMLACGSRACVSFGYVGGYVSDVADPDAAVTCIR